MDQTTKVKLWMNTTSDHSIRFHSTKEMKLRYREKEKEKKDIRTTATSSVEYPFELRLLFVRDCCGISLIQCRNDGFSYFSSFFYAISFVYRSDLSFNFHMNDCVLGPIPRRHYATDHGRMFFFFFSCVPYYIHFVLFHVNWIRLGKIWQQRACMHTYIKHVYGASIVYMLRVTPCSLE